jgi:HAD superfamily hydrolase (TIGR01549 family)
MFIYFDLGNVLAMFDRQQAARQVAAISGITPAEARRALFESPLNHRYERGELSSREFYAEFCRETRTEPDYAALHHAAADIFQLNHSLIPLVMGLEDAGHRLGILSNTSPCHWEFLCDQGYGILPRSFEVHALSYEIGAMKPEPKIYQAAAELAGVEPREIFFCDDIPEHVAAARRAGFDAEPFTTTPALVADLRRRGLQFNY